MKMICPSMTVTVRMKMKIQIVDEQGNASEDHCGIDKDLNFLKSVHTRSIS